MRLTTWNVNSIRTRLDRVLDFLARSHTDVLAMQELKCRPDQFPFEEFHAAGWEVAMTGLNQWNGVAIASRIGIDNVRTAFPSQPAFDRDTGPVPAGADTPVEARAIGATCGGVEVWSLYVPHGRALDHPHYRYKLAFLDALRADMADELTTCPEAPIALVGDWNIAPRDDDVWDPSVFAGLTHVSAPERAAFTAFADLGFEEVTRERVSNYTYWDYQKLRFPKNEGMRIDFVYASPALARTATAAMIDRDERKGKGASDHVPVIVDFAIDGE